LKTNKRGKRKSSNDNNQTAAGIKKAKLLAATELKAAKNPKRLFKPDPKSLIKPEIWETTMLIAPDNSKSNWKTSDAIYAYCTKCNTVFEYHCKNNSMIDAMMTDANVIVMVIRCYRYGDTNKLHQEFTGLYLQHLQENDVELQENHQAVRVTSRLPRSDDSSGTIPSMDSRATFFTHSASIYKDSQIDWEYIMEFPSMFETNNSAQKQSHPNSPSITLGITGKSLSSTSAQGGPSYASATAKQTPDPDILELKKQLAELETTIQVQQQQPQQTSALPAPNPLQPFFHQNLQRQSRT
jgi:hypothetical protein